MSAEGKLNGIHNFLTLFRRNPNKIPNTQTSHHTCLIPKWRIHKSNLHITKRIWKKKNQNRLWFRNHKLKILTPPLASKSEIITSTDTIFIKDQNFISSQSKPTKENYQSWKLTFQNDKFLHQTKKYKLPHMI